MYDFDLIDVTVSNGVLNALIDNPPINLITRQLYGELRKLATEAANDDEARVVVLKSANAEFFLAHFDVEVILAAPTDGAAEQAVELSGFHQMTETFRTMPKPTICQIAGRVGGGGGEIAASCDMRFGATGRTILCQMEVPLGILPGGSGTQRLPGLVGRGAAMEIVLAGDDIDALTLERWGWLNRAMEPDELDAYVRRFAARIASFSPEALALAKESVLAAVPDPRAGLLTEAHLFQRSLRSPGTTQRMERFLEIGGQTLQGERRVGELGGEIGGGTVEL